MKTSLVDFLQQRKVKVEKPCECSFCSKLAIETGHITIGNKTFFLRWCEDDLSEFLKAADLIGKENTALQMV